MKMFKKIFFLLVVLFISKHVLSTRIEKKCSTVLQVVVNARRFLELPVYKIQGLNEGYILLKDLAKIFSGTITYHQVGKYVSFNCRGEKIYFFYNKNFFIWSQQKFYLSNNVVNINNRTFVPLSIVVNPSFTSILNVSTEFRQKENLLIVDWFDTVRVSYYVTKNDARIEFRFHQNVQHDYSLEDYKIIVTFFPAQASPKEYYIENGIISKIQLRTVNTSVVSEIVLRNREVNIKKEDYKDKVVLILRQQEAKLAKNLAQDVSQLLPSPTQKSNTDKVIVIDPGHGGEDPGAIGKYGTKEKNVNLAIAKLVKEKLINAGYRVLLTREDDRFIPLVKRTQFANDNNADLFISIHCNASWKSTGTDHGVEVYFLSEKATDPDSIATEKLENEVVIKYEKPTEELTKLQKILWSMIVTEYMNEASKLCGYIGTEIVNRTGQNYRGVKQAGFYVLRGAQMPAVLVEVGFISNPTEELKLNRLDFQELIADGIVAGIQKYYENNR